MKTKLKNQLPKTADEIPNGGVYRQAVRCGKLGCRCAVGILHQGFFYFIHRIGGRLTKTYIPKRYVDQLSVIVQEARRNREIERETRASSRNLLSEMGEQLRECESTIRSLAEGPEQNGGAKTNK